jgi:eukaryotic-like serine/threonine-protein kinase
MATEGARRAPPATETSAEVDEVPVRGSITSLAPGEILEGKYQLLRKLEEGGMGVVWVAHNVGLDAHVALKLLREEGGDPEAAERLLVEARAAARLDHPGILRIFDVGRTAGGDPFLVMELLDGEALADTLGRDGFLEPVLTVRTLLPIVGALGALHARGMLHRDIKPENIFLARDDSGRWQPKLIDFGLARLGGRGGITQRGIAVGTPGYMAPEQLMGNEVDARTDLWAVCVVLYETLSGRLPFGPLTPAALLGAMLANRPRPLTEGGRIDAGLWEIVARGFERPAHRWSSALEVGRALALWLWDRGVTDDISGVSLRSTWLGEDDVRRVSHVSQVRTARFPALLAARGATAEVPTPEPAPARSEVPIEPADPPANTSGSPAPVLEEAPREARRTATLALALALAAVAAGALAIAAVRRAPQVASLPAEPQASAPVPIGEPAAPPALSAAPEVTTAAASATPAAPPRAPKRSPRGAGSVANPDADLKNPFR